MFKDKERQREYTKEHYLKNKALYSLRNAKRRKERSEWFVSVTSGISCVVCGEKERVCLDFHHLDPKTKLSSVSKLLNDHRSRKRILEEVQKCTVLCSNCHRKLHGGIVKLPKTI